MQRFIFILVGLVLAGAIGITVMDSGKAPPPEHGGETSDRLSSDRMEKMVAGEMKLVEKKDMAGAARLFEADLAKARAKGGLAAGDLLTAYGVQLRVADHEKESIPYFRRAVEAYRAAAPGSPELALALSDYAKVLFLDSPEAPSPAALPALREALALREKALGRKNAETAMNYVRLGELQGLPVFTGRDPAKVAAAADLIRTGIRLLPDTPNADESDLPGARLDLAQLYARNGDADGAFKAAGEYLAANPGFGAYQLRRVAVTFEKAGDAAAGKRLREAYAIPDEKDEPDEDDDSDEPKAVAEGAAKKAAEEAAKAAEAEIKPAEAP